MEISQKFLSTALGSFGPGLSHRNYYLKKTAASSFTAVYGGSKFLPSFAAC
jgi:hypothetical protein